MTTKSRILCTPAVLVYFKIIWFYLLHKLFDDQKLKKELLEYFEKYIQSTPCIWPNTSHLIEPLMSNQILTVRLKPSHLIKTPPIQTPKNQCISCLSWIWWTDIWTSCSGKILGVFDNWFWSPVWLWYWVKLSNFYSRFYLWLQRQMTTFSTFHTETEIWLGACTW